MMTGTQREFTFPSSSSLCDIFAKAYLPEDGVKIKAVLQIAHGMAEHHERYEDFIAYLNENGFAVYINDHLGHGKSVANDGELGYFGRNAGYIYLMEDMKKLNDIIKEENPGVPVILFGHSMGSFLSRLYTEKYGSSLTGAVYCGTAGSNPAAQIGMTVVKAIVSLKGDHYRSRFIDNLAFGSYNKKIVPARTSYDWLTTRTDIVDKYIADPYCGFLFTTCGYKDLMHLLVIINRPDWYTSVPVDLPIYLIAGGDDPVGNYGKGVTDVYHGLIDSKHTDVAMKLYPGDRHEILNEKDNRDVYADVLRWINTVID